MTQLVQLVYVSTSQIIWSDKCLEDLLVHSRKYNKAHGITGVLLYKNGRFMQVIEGLESDIDFLFLKIQQDSAHNYINKLFMKPIPHRIFPEWSMGFRRASPEKLDGFTDFLSLKNEGDIPSLPAQLLLFCFKEE
jgi:hypothetical protein